MLLSALRSLFADIDWQASPTAAALVDAVDGTEWTIEGSHHIARSVDGLPCRVLRDSNARALIANVRMHEPWAFVFHGESSPVESGQVDADGLFPALHGYRFTAPEAFLRGLAGGPQVSSLLEALRRDGVHVEMHDGRVGLTQRGANPDEAPILGDAAIALAGALRDAWDRLVETPLRDEGLVWDGVLWSRTTRHAVVEVEPGRRLAIRARFPTILPPGSCLRPRQPGEPRADLPGGLGHELTMEGEAVIEGLDDSEVGEALLGLLRDPGSRLDANGLELRFRSWPIGDVLTQCFEDIASVYDVLNAPR